MPKVILISQFSLPYPKIGSWTKMYASYLQGNHQIDYIICEQPESLFSNVEYVFLTRNKGNSLLQRWNKKPYIAYLKALKKILKKDEHYIIQIIDNFGIIPHLQKFLLQNGLRKNCYLQFFYHGFAPFYGNLASRFFYETINEMVLITKDSYKVHKEYYTVLPCKFSVHHNGIDKEKFFKISQEHREILKEELNIKQEKVFVWCSKDHPKKGLDFILPVWKKVHEKYEDSILLVIGASRSTAIKGVRFLGSVSNHEVPKYYQIADAYLFPTLWHEGFGLSLIEALLCGCYCIASALGGVPEVLQYGKLGKLIENPHFEAEWENAIVAFLTQTERHVIEIPDGLYTAETWNSGMKNIIENAKKVFK